MPQYNPGDAIASRCLRCNDVTGHVVVALVGGEVAKVECRACGSVHKHRPPEPKAAAGTEKARRVRQGSSREAVMKAEPVARTPRQTKASLRVLRAAEAVENEWRTALLKAGDARPYSMDGRFLPDEVLDHPVFGNGIVKELVPPDKVRVLFRDGQRLLRCAG